MKAWRTWLKEFLSSFIPEKRTYVVVEVEKELPLQGEPVDHVLAVKALEHNPGFQYLIRKFRLQRAALKAHMLQDKHKSLAQVVRIQEAIRWSGWIEDQLSRALAWRPPQAVDPQAELLAEFTRVHRELFNEDPKP